MSTVDRELDWRLDNARHLASVTLHWQRYYRWSDTWDHDHCAGCWAKFMEAGQPDTLQIGYATGDDDPRGARYDWVRETCFDELKPVLNWTSSSREPGSSAC